jgi:hypothetical protein
MHCVRGLQGGNRTKDDSLEPCEFFFTARMRELLLEQREHVDALQMKHHKIIRWVFPDSNGDPLFRIVVDDGVETKRAPQYSKNVGALHKRKSKVFSGTHSLRVTACVERDNAGLSIEDNKNAGGWRATLLEGI